MTNVIGPNALKARTQSINNQNVKELLHEIRTHLEGIVVYNGGNVKISVSIDPTPYNTILTSELCSGPDGWSRIVTDAFWDQRDASGIFYVTLVP